MDLRELQLVANHAIDSSAVVNFAGTEKELIIG